MAIDEAARLAAILHGDPTSQTAAAAAGWDYPISREALILADLFDLQHASKVKKAPAPYPRPWGVESLTRSRGDAAGRTREEVIEILRSQFGRDPADSAKEA